jgi:hypothetical protein
MVRNNKCMSSIMGSFCIVRLIVLYLYVSQAIFDVLILQFCFLSYSPSFFKHFNLLLPLFHLVADNALSHLYASILILLLCDLFLSGLVKLHGLLS